MVGSGGGGGGDKVTYVLLVIICFVCLFFLGFEYDFKNMWCKTYYHEIPISHLKHAIQGINKYMVPKFLTELPIHVFLRCVFSCFYSEKLLTVRDVYLLRIFLNSA